MVTLDTQRAQLQIQGGCQIIKILRGFPPPPNSPIKCLVLLKILGELCRLNSLVAASEPHSEECCQGILYTRGKGMYPMCSRQPTMGWLLQK
jgi:hypothetical protein